MKNFLIVVSICLLSLSLLAQQPVSLFSEWLSIDTSFTLENVDATVNNKNWVATVSQDVFYCCQRKAFHAKENSFRCILYRVDLNTFEQDTVMIDYPAMGSSWKKDAESCYVYALSVENDRLLMVCDHQLLLYKIDNQRYKFVNRLSCFGVYTAYLYQRRIYALVDDKEQGLFRWLCFERDKGKKWNVIRELEQSAPFLLQFDPNRYLFVNENNVYYLSPGQCSVQKFSLQGDLLDSICFSLPNRKVFPSELLSHLRELPYGTERIFYALNHRYRQYSFVKTIDPLNDTLLLLSVNLGDESIQRQLAVMCLRKSGNVWKQEFSTIAVKDTGQLYKMGMFPVSYHLSADNILVYPYHDHLLQLLMAPEKEDYEGLSAMQYRRYKDNWFKDHDPVVKFRSQKVRTECMFYDYDNHKVTLSDLKKDKVIFLVNQQPQCSACQKQLLLFLSAVDTSQVTVACRMGKVDGYLARRQQLQSMTELVPRFFHPLYDMEGENYWPLFKLDAYPALFLWHRNFGFVGAYSTEEIFTSNYDRYEFSDTFLKDFQQFVKTDDR